MASSNPAPANQKLFSVNKMCEQPRALQGLRGRNLEGPTGRGMVRIQKNESFYIPRQRCKNNKPHLAFSSYISWSRE